MKKSLLRILIYGFILISLTGCTLKKDKENIEKELFSIGHTLNDGRIIHFTFDIPYKEKTIMESLINDEISIDEFINKLEYIDSLNDGTSKLYKYNKDNKEFGNEDFYLLNCNSLDNIKDIYVAKKIESLEGKCSIKINDLEGVSMTIKKGTLTNTGATIIITDTTDRNNIYGDEYKIEKKENDIWVELDVVVEGNYGWNTIGYNVGEDKKLELQINWEWLYGSLENGIYRIVKGTSYPLEGTIHYITTEFELK